MQFGKNCRLRNACALWSIFLCKMSISFLLHLFLVSCGYICHYINTRARKAYCCWHLNLCFFLKQHNVKKWNSFYFSSFHPSIWLWDMDLDIRGATKWRTSNNVEAMEQRSCNCIWNLKVVLFLYLPNQYKLLKIYDTVWTYYKYIPTSLH